MKRIHTIAALITLFCSISILPCSPGIQSATARQDRPYKVSTTTNRVYGNVDTTVPAGVPIRRSAMRRIERSTFKFVGIGTYSHRLQEKKATLPIYGTLFAVARDFVRTYFLTSMHLLSAPKHPPAIYGGARVEFVRERMDYFYIDHEGYRHPLRLEAADRDDDLALVSSLTYEPTFNGCIATGPRPSRGDPLVGGGFPHGKKQTFVNSRFHRETFEWFLVQQTTAHGFSGGPVYLLERGRPCLLGVTSRVPMIDRVSGIDPNSLTRITKNQSILRLLNRVGLQLGSGLRSIRPDS